MQVTKKLEAGHLSVAVNGRLDTNTAPQLQDELKLEGVTELDFDLTDLEYMSSAGLRVLLSAQKAMMGVGGKMTIRNPNAMVKDVFDITGCSDIFTIV